MYKAITDHSDAALRFLRDLESDGVLCYDIPSFNSDIIPSVYPASYLNKCSHVTVALSGCAPEARQYMVVCPHRVDHDRKSSGFVHDLDPLILTLDANTQEPSPVAVIGYHQSFPGRTSPIAGFTLSDHATTVSQLRSAIITGLDPLSAIPGPVESSLHHMADYYRRFYGL